MIRSTWAELPKLTRSAVQAHIGPVEWFEPVESGNHAEITGTAHTPAGLVFLKGAAEGVEARVIRYEARVLPSVTQFAPRLLASVDAGGWSVLALEKIEGRHADFSPGSPDLAGVAKLVTELQSMTSPDQVTMRITGRWEQIGDASPMDGNALLHCDINTANVLVTGDRFVLVDWAFTSRGAAWAEPALMIPWLLKAGHSPAEAEEWVSQFSSWADADPAHIDLQSQLNAERWRQHSTRRPDLWVAEYAALARMWADHRTR